MGYNTWNDYRCALKASDVEEVIAAFVRLDFLSHGYQYVNIDDCWAVGRSPNGTILVDTTKFPSGIKPLADLAHLHGLKLGIYSDRGNLTCQKRPGSLGYEKLDADTYASWGIDYLKEDSCFASSDHETAFKEYATMRNALNATGRPILFSLCGWHDWYAPVGKELGNSWRIAHDVNTYAEMQNAIDVSARVAEYASAGAFNDPDMLVGSSSAAAVHLTQAQSRSQFSMWAVLSAPLLLGANVVNLNSWDLETYTNKEVIAVNQDPLAVAGTRLFGTNLTSGGEQNIWSKPLADGSIAMVFFNNGLSVQSVTCDAKCFQKTSIGDAQFSVRDLWSHQELGSFNGSFTSIDIPGYGASAMYKIEKKEQ